MFRILIGLLILIDLSVRAGSLVAHYTDAGIVSREALRAFGELPLYLSIHALSGSAWFQIIVFVITAIAAAAFMVGYRTRIATVLCWVLMLSLHVRNPFINNLGDWLLVDLLFFSMFLPLGARFSMDARHREQNVVLPQQVLSVATLGIMLQMCFMYYFSTYHKFTPDWHADGTALAFALNLDRLTQPFGNFMRTWPPDLLKALTLFAYNLEKWGPVLFFVPLFTGPIRTVVIGSFIAFHAILAVTVEIGVFPYICIAAWILLLPAWTLGHIERLWAHISSIKLRQYVGTQWKRVLIIVSGFDKKKRLQSNRVFPNALETLLAVFGLWFMMSSGLLYIGKMGEDYYDHFYRYVEPLGNSLNLHQRWDMFSPSVPRRDGWFVMAGHQQNGDSVDVFTGQPVTWKRPELISATYQNQRWRKNLEWVMNGRGPHARMLGEYYWTQWNCLHPAEEQITRLDIVFMAEYTLDNMESSPVKRQVLYTTAGKDLQKNCRLEESQKIAGTP